MSARLKPVCLAIYVVSLVLVLAPLMTLACDRGTPALQLPEAPQEIRSYPTTPDYRVAYEHPEEHWRISYPAEWGAGHAFGSQGYSSVYVNGSSWGWEMSITREDVADRLGSYQQQSGRNYDSYAAASEHLAGAAEWDEDKPVREVIFLGGEDVTIEGYAAYLAEYSWAPEDKNLGQGISSVLGLFLVVGTDKFEVTLKGSPARMLSARNEMRDMLLSFQPPRSAPRPVALPPAPYVLADAVVASDVRGESKLTVVDRKVTTVRVTVVGTVTNTSNRSVDFNLLGVVYDKNGAILGTSGQSWQYYWDRHKEDFVRHPSLVFHLAPGWVEQVAFYLFLSPDEFDRAISVAVLVVPR